MAGAGVMERAKIGKRSSVVDSTVDEAAVVPDNIVLLFLQIGERLEERRGT